MKVLLASHGTALGSTGGVRFGTKYLVGTGTGFATLSWGSELTFPSNGGPHWLGMDPVSKTLVLFGEETGVPNGLTLWRSTTGGTSWVKIGTLASLLGISATVAYFSADAGEAPCAFDDSGNLLIVLEDATNRLVWARSADLGTTWSGPHTWTGGVDFFAVSVHFGGGRWGVTGLAGVAVSDASTPTDFSVSLSSAGLETLFMVLGFAGDAWFITQPGSDPPCLKRCTSAVLASGSWQAAETLVNSTYQGDVYEGNKAGGGVSQFFHYLGGVTRLQRFSGDYRMWLHRIPSSLLFSDETDGTTWDKSEADHTAGSPAGMNPLLDWRRTNFSAGDFDFIVSIVNDPNSKDSVAFFGWTYEDNGGLTYRRAVYAVATDGGTNPGPAMQLPVSSGEWGVAFVLEGGSGGGGSPGAPAPDKPARISRDSVIFNFSPLPSANLMRFLRGEGYAFREEMYELLLQNQPPVEAPIVASERARMPALLAEPLIPDGCRVLHPFDFAASPSYEDGEWQHDAGITLEQAPPLVRGLPCTRIVNDGTSDWNGVWQNLLEDYTGSPETMVFLVRRGSVDRAELWVWDPGLDDDVYEVEFNLRDGSVAPIYGNGTARMIRVPTLGGGPAAWLIFVTVVGTDNEIPSFGFMPTTRAAMAGFTDVAFLGWVRGAAGVNPLSGAMIAGGQAWFPNVPALGESTWAGRLVLGYQAGLDDVGRYFWHRGQLDGSPPYLALRSEAGAIFAEHDNGSDPAVESRVSGIQWKEGDELRYVLSLLPGGALHLALSLRQEAPLQGAVSVDHPIADSQYDDALVLCRGDADQARCHHLRLVGLHSSHLLTVPGTSGAGLMLEEPRKYWVRTNGLGDPI